MRKLYSISLAFCLSVLLLPGCRQDVMKGNTEAEYGNLSLTFSTKSTAADSYDGHAFHNLLVILTDKSNRVYASKWIDEVPTGATTHEHWDEKTVNFELVQIGSYNIYAYANIDNTDYPVNGSPIESVEKLYTKGDDLDPDRELAVLSSSAVPGAARFDGQKSEPSYGMILAGKGTVDVGVISSADSVALLRPFCRLNVYVNNHADMPVTLKSLSFSKFNASRTYLFDHSENGHPGIPTGNSYRNLPEFNGSIVVLANGRDSLVYSTLLYENENTATGFEYRLFGSAEMNGVTKSIEVKNVNLKTYSNINSMSTGSSMPILLVNPLTNNGKIVGNTSVKSANFKGGNKNYVTNFVKSYSDDSDFIFYLKKTDSSHYSFYRDEDCTNVCTWGGVTSFTLAQGTFTSGNSYDFANSDLCNFKASNGYYLYNTGTTTLNTRSGANKECQWAIYEPSIVDGSPLRVVDNKTGQVSVLNKMFRNQELNIIINVYHNQAAGHFDFDVDNAYWTGGHTMTHIFR